MKKRQLLTVLLILSVSCAFLPFVHAADWLEGFEYRKKIVVDQTAGAGTGYEVPFDLRWGMGTDSNNSIIYLNAHSQNDFDDVRFTRADSATLLDYYFINKVDGVSAFTYVEIQSDLDLGDATIYLYYGNDTVSGVSNLTNTFVDAILDDVVLAFNWDEGSGSTSIDHSPYGNNGTNTGLTYNSGIFDTCIGNFTQSHASHIVVPDDNSLTFGDDGFTWLMWLNDTKITFGVGQEWATVFTKDNFIYEYWMTLFSAAYEQHARLADMDFVDSGGSVSYNTWNHHVVRWNGTSGGYVDWFINGSFIESDAWSTGFSGATQTQDLWFGQVAPGGYDWEGEMDELIFVNASITNAQISNCFTYYPDVRIQEGDVYVREVYLETEPSWNIFDEEEQEEEGEWATKGEFLAAAVVASFILIPLLILIFGAARRRR